jgi:hypothetical protein
MYKVKLREHVVRGILRFIPLLKISSSYKGIYWYSSLCFLPHGFVRMLLTRAFLAASPSFLSVPALHWPDSERRVMVVRQEEACLLHLPCQDFQCYLYEKADVAMSFYYIYL